MRVLWVPLFSVLVCLVVATSANAWRAATPEEIAAINVEAVNVPSGLASTVSVDNVRVLPDGGMAAATVYESRYGAEPVPHTAVFFLSGTPGAITAKLYVSYLFEPYCEETRRDLFTDIEADELALVPGGCSGGQPARLTRSQFKRLELTRKRSNATIATVNRRLRSCNDAGNLKSLRRCALRVMRRHYVAPATKLRQVVRKLEDKVSWASCESNLVDYRKSTGKQVNLSMRWVKLILAGRSADARYARRRLLKQHARVKRDWRFVRSSCKPRA